MPARNVPAGASKPVVLIGIGMLLFQTCAAQNPSVHEANAYAASAAAPLNSGSTQTFSTTRDRKSSNISVAGDGNTGCARPEAISYRAQAERLGRSYAEHLETTSKLITDQVIAEYVKRIAQNLVRNSEPPIHVTVKILDSDEISAFSLPGGFVFVDSGLILAAGNEAELAGVISHEIAHLAACHAAQEMAREELTNPASTPLIFRIVFSHAMRNTIYLKPTGSFESEADFFGLKYLYEAGYDPQSLPSFLEKVRARENQNRRTTGLDAQSLIAERIKRTQQEITALLADGSEYKLDTSEFQEMKKRLADLQNRPMDTKGGNQPASQHASARFEP